MVLEILTIDLDPMGIWRLGLFVGVLLCFLSWFKIYRFNIQSLLWSYVVCYCIFVLEFPFRRYGIVDTPFVASAGRTCLEAIIIPLTILNLNKRRENNFLTLFEIFALIEIVLIWTIHYGAMLQTSFDSALLCCFVPFTNPIIAIMIIVTALTHHGGTATVILLTQLVVMCIKYKHARRFVVAGFPLGLAYLWFRFHDLALGGNERILAYKRFMSAWWNDGWVTRIFGSGPGSFQYLTFLIEQSKKEIFLMMHSDWLQIIFEFGIVGFILTVLFIISAIQKSWNRPNVLAGVFGCCAFALTYHGLRFMPGMLLYAYIFKQAFYGNEKGTLS